MVSNKAIKLAQELVKKDGYKLESFPPTGPIRLRNGKIQVIIFKSKKHE